MTKSYLSSPRALRAWQVERASAAVSLTQAGRLAIPLQLRRVSSPLSFPVAALVLTAEGAQALCDEINVLLVPDSAREAG